MKKNDWYLDDDVLVIDERVYIPLQHIETFTFHDSIDSVYDKIEYKGHKFTMNVIGHVTLYGKYELLDELEVHDMLKKDFNNGDLKVNSKITVSCTLTTIGGKVSTIKMSDNFKVSGIDVDDKRKSIRKRCADVIVNQLRTVNKKTKLTFKN